MFLTPKLLEFTPVLFRQLSHVVFDFFLTESSAPRQQPHFMLLTITHGDSASASQHFPLAQKGLGTQAHPSLQEYAHATLSSGTFHLGFGIASYFS